MILPPELSFSPISNHPLTKQEELAKEVINFALRIVFFMLLMVL
jgi:hypothetical protein